MYMDMQQQCTSSSQEVLNSNALEGILLFKLWCAEKPYATCCAGLDNILDLHQCWSIPGKRWPQPEGPACCGVLLADALPSAAACLAPVIHKQVYQHVSSQATVHMLILMNCK